MSRLPSCLCGVCPKCKHRDYMRRWYANNAERARATARRTRLRHLDKIRAYDRARGFRVYDAEKVAARRAVTYALRDGTLKRQGCAVCGNPAEAHHDDYSRPLEIRWLCRTHHGEVHRKIA